MENDSRVALRLASEVFKKIEHMTAKHPEVFAPAPAVYLSVAIITTPCVSNHGDPTQAVMISYKRRSHQSDRGSDKKIATVRFEIR